MRDASGVVNRSTEHEETDAPMDIDVPLDAPASQEHAQQDRERLTDKAVELEEACRALERCEENLDQKDGDIKKLSDDLKRYRSWWLNEFYCIKGALSLVRNPRDAGVQAAMKEFKSHARYMTCYEIAVVVYFQFVFDTFLPHWQVRLSSDFPDSPHLRSPLSRVLKVTPAWDASTNPLQALFLLRLYHGALSRSIPALCVDRRTPTGFSSDPFPHSKSFDCPQRLLSTGRLAGTEEAIRDDDANSSRLGPAENTQKRRRSCASPVLPCPLFLEAMLAVAAPSKYQVIASVH
ncbi:hypothetical protein NMY22_g15376 [Coprinellus aureogranulatus]|nr:hypothetical protein NMY22_g15376 [Coprinellus aureogranulatus]